MNKQAAFDSPDALPLANDVVKALGGSMRIWGFTMDGPHLLQGSAYYEVGQIEWEATIGKVALRLTYTGGGPRYFFFFQAVHTGSAKVLDTKKIEARNYHELGRACTKARKLVGDWWDQAHQMASKPTSSALTASFGDESETEFVVEGDNRKGFLALLSGGDINLLTGYLNRYMVAHMPRPQSVPKFKGAVKAFSFHWSNAQAQWDVISIKEFPWGIDGAEFIVFIGKNAVSPTGSLWTLTEMKYVAKKLHPHPGAAMGVR